MYQWTLRLLPFVDYCKYCCDEHRDACVFSNYCFGFFWINTQKKNWCNWCIMYSSNLNFLRILHAVFLLWLRQFTVLDDTIILNKPIIFHSSDLQFWGFFDSFSRFLSVIFSLYLSFPFHFSILACTLNCTTSSLKNYDLASISKFIYSDTFFYFTFATMLIFPNLIFLYNFSYVKCLF